MRQEHVAIWEQIMRNHRKNYQDIAETLSYFMRDREVRELAPKTIKQAQERLAEIKTECEGVLEILELAALENALEIPPSPKFSAESLQRSQLFLDEVYGEISRNMTEPEDLETLGRRFIDIGQRLIARGIGWPAAVEAVYRIADQGAPTGQAQAQQKESD